MIKTESVKGTAAKSAWKQSWDDMIGETNLVRVDQLHCHLVVYAEYIGSFWLPANLGELTLKIENKYYVVDSLKLFKETGSAVVFLRRRSGTPSTNSILIDTASKND